MEPRIQYAKTKDGVNIAFWTFGEGMPVVHMASLGASHIQLEWQVPECRRWYERLAHKRKLVRYDMRGHGLSDRDVTDYSLEGHVQDLEAVVDRLSLERPALLGVLHSGPTAIAYAARHPERVSHLILWFSYRRSSDFLTAQLETMRSLIDRDWELFTETQAHALVGWSEGQAAHRLASYMRESSTREVIWTALGATREFDVTALVPQVTSPTLVLHRRQWPYLDVDVARGLASRIPDARLALLEGESLAPFVGDMEAVATAIDEFLGEGEEAPAAAELPEGMAVLLFADITESTALTEQLGDTAFRAKTRELDTSLRSVINEAAGTPVEGKVLGDGGLAVFTSARQAIDCALRCEAAGEPLGLKLHLGIHAGDVIREGSNVYGGAVNIAARIAAA